MGKKKRYLTKNECYEQIKSGDLLKMLDHLSEKDLLVNIAYIATCIFALSLEREFEPDAE